MTFQETALYFTTHFEGITVICGERAITITVHDLDVLDDLIEQLDLLCQEWRDFLFFFNGFMVDLILPYED